MQQLLDKFQRDRWVEMLNDLYLDYDMYSMLEIAELQKDIDALVEYLQGKPTDDV